jgi:phage shock protein C
MLGGVCAGLGKYFRIDTTIIRIFFVIFTLAGGIGPLVYLILWIVVPPEGHMTELGQGDQFNKEEFKDRAGMMRDDLVGAVSTPNPNVIRFLGIGLVLAGIILVLKQFNFAWLNWLNNGVLWAVLIVIAGVALLVRGTRGD